ncbi:Phosphoglycerate dehydrogenase and related dehydrogenase [Hahella chejuensis KCTC 2396]|uniref:Phosphoglycerate dehydrogenase and related dehydrogenase n=1 Tax=Hahella chejuensis (strain KCTC 2396) TaxID=349521 RepID=Q2S7E0_HAHCH|nr:NAD(P)-dependent oxidoreductase [Hahella chejuensis]ABC33434.1 Phosphoglycerate dehydrogenase and related dehydrogenase [Hahella chejuensis KCTC 2396]
MNIVFHSGAFDLQEWRRVAQTISPEFQLQAPEDVAIEEIDVLLIWRPTLTDWTQARNLKLVIGLGAGIDGLIRQLRLPPNTPVERMRDAGMRQAMSEYATYAVLHFQRNFDQFRQAQQENNWLTHSPYRANRETRVGVLGLGSLGGAVAQRLHNLGYPTSGWSRSPKTLSGVAAYAGEDRLNEFLGQCDILINMLPHNAATEGFLNQDRLSQLPPGAALICVSRGAVTDENALLEHLDSGHLRGAMMDVFQQEPLPADHPLWSHPKVWVTPHQSAPTQVEPALREVMDILRDRTLA